MSKRGAGILKAQPLSEALAEFMGKTKASRADVMKAVWRYIKQNDLNEGRTIHPDEVIGSLVGTRSLDMFQLTKKLSQHIG